MSSETIDQCPKCDSNKKIEYDLCYKCSQAAKGYKHCIRCNAVCKIDRELCYDCYSKDTGRLPCKGCGKHNLGATATCMYCSICVDHLYKYNKPKFDIIIEEIRADAERLSALQEDLNKIACQRCHKKVIIANENPLFTKKYCDVCVAERKTEMISCFYCSEGFHPNKPGEKICYNCNKKQREETAVKRSNRSNTKRKVLTPVTFVAPI